MWKRTDSRTRPAYAIGRAPFDDYIPLTFVVPKGHLPRSWRAYRRFPLLGPIYRLRLQKLDDPLLLFLHLVHARRDHLSGSLVGHVLEHPNHHGSQCAGNPPQILHDRHDTDGKSDPC